MATPIDQIGQHELNPTLKALAKAGGTTDHAQWMRSGKNPALLMDFIREQVILNRKNPHEMTVESQLAALSRADEQELVAGNNHWVATSGKCFERLARTAPPWPRGGSSFRSLRIRFGRGTSGVQQTFMAHLLRIHRVFRDVNDEYLFLKHGGFEVSPPNLLKGDHTHRACVEWVLIDTSKHRRRNSVSDVRGRRSLADELFVMAWLFPDLIRSIDGDESPDLFAAGYKTSCKQLGEDGVPMLSYKRDLKSMIIKFGNRFNCFTNSSVPELLPHTHHKM